jgi:hypothetical protein
MPGGPKPIAIYVDADARPVKAEVYPLKKPDLPCLGRYLTRALEAFTAPG